MVFALVAPCILRQIRVIPNFCDDRDKTSSRMRIMKGDATVIEYLNRGLRHELAAINQYWLHYRLLENWGYGALAKKRQSLDLNRCSVILVTHLLAPLFGKSSLRLFT